jgi:MFS family permease
MESEAAETAVERRGDLPVATAPLAMERLPLPSAFAFVGSGCLLVLEIVAGRILAPSIGVSLYTWTSVIGVVLGGLALGNYLGGLAADWRPKLSTLSTLYLLCSLTSALILAFASDTDSVAAPKDWAPVIQVLWLAALLFFVPSVLLGTVTPVSVKRTRRSLATTGHIVGRIQAAATLGSIVGTFATGFLFISWFGTRAIVAGVAVTLFLLAILSNPVWTRLRAGSLALVAIVLIALALRADDPCLRESNYYCIRVDSVGPGIAALRLDFLTHGYVDLSNPSHLIYPYEELYDDVIRKVYPRGTHLDAASLGAGTYTFARYIEANYSGKVFVAEIDPEVTQVARDYFGLRDSSRLEIEHQDARFAFRNLPSNERFDVVHGDVFNDLSVPYHLATREFNDLVASHLEPDGFYIVTLVDGVRYEFLRSYMRTMRLTFPYVRLMVLPHTWPLTGLRSTFVVVASRRPPPVIPGRTLSQPQVDQFMRSGHSITLTDDHAPVDQLLAPVFLQRLELERLAQ